MSNGYNGVLPLDHRLYKDEHDKVVDAGIDTLAVMDRAIESAGLMVKESGDMRAVAYQDDLFKARAAVAELIEASTVLRARLCFYGDWEDGCFYYNRYSAPELMAPMAGIDAALARVRGAA